MKRGEFTDEKILSILQEAEAGRPAADVARAHGITATTQFGEFDPNAVLRNLSYQGKQYTVTKAGVTS